MAPEANGTAAGPGVQEVAPLRPPSSPTAGTPEGVVSIDEATRRVARLLRGAPTDGVDPAALPEPWRSLAERIVAAEPGQRLEAFAAALAAQPAEDARALRLALIAVDPDEPPSADGADAPPAGATGATGATPPRLPFRTARELAAETPEVVEWVAEPWVALGCITELDGRPKTAGKTTWVLHLCKAVLDGAPFMGAPTRRSGVVYLTEQAPRSFRSTLERAGLLDRDDLLVLRWHDARGTAWPDVAAAGRRRVPAAGVRAARRRHPAPVRRPARRVGEQLGRRPGGHGAAAGRGRRRDRGGDDPPRP